MQRNRSTTVLASRAGPAAIFLGLLLAWSSLAGCLQADYQIIGEIQRADPAIDELIPEDAEIRVLAENFEWGEGPVWVPGDRALLFSDIPKNTIYQWDDRRGLSVFLRPAGYMWADPPGGELGTNGLVLDARGRLVMCDHGNHAIARLNRENFTRTILVDSYQGKRLNSPNDLVYRSNGDLYFTDPPYGLKGLNDSPVKELEFNGVYRLPPDGEPELLTRELTFPNGIAFSPSEAHLYVSVSDADYPRWMVYDVRNDGFITNGSVFYDASRWHRQGRPGLPDGMAVDTAGNLFATGPGGVHIFAPDGTHLGTLDTGQATANCTFGGPDGTTLFITADMYLLQVNTLTRRLGF